MASLKDYADQAMAQVQPLELPDWSKDPTKANLQEMAGPMQGATQWNVDDSQLVSRQLSGLLAKDSPYLTQARTRAAQLANSRGLLNSTMAATAGESAAIEAARPIAEADARTYGDSARFNAEQSNLFSRDANAFGRDVALSKFQGVLDLAAQERNNALERARIGVDAAYRDSDLSLRDRQLTADQQYRMDDLALRRDDLGLRRDQFASEEDFRNAELALRRDEFGADTSLQRDELALRREELAARQGEVDSNAQQNLTQEIARVRSAALDARYRLESDPNMSKEAKEAAILAIGQQASADIRELVQFSGIDLPDAWPDWINDLGTVAPVNAESGVAAPPPPRAYDPYNYGSEGGY